MARRRGHIDEQILATLRQAEGVFNIMEYTPRAEDNVPAQDHHRYTASPSQTDPPRYVLLIPLTRPPSFGSLSPTYR